MPQYIFDALRADDVAKTWDYAEMENDAAAMAYAAKVLNAHASAARVAVFEGDRHVGDVSDRPGAAPSAPLHGCSILVVEDRFLLAEELRRLLREAGAEVVGPFPDAPLAIAATRRRKPTCALVDINLGDGPNFEVAEALLAAGVPLVLVTGYDAKVVPPTLAEVPHLHKPARRDEVLAAVERLCRQAA